jgi:hypothetical protein
MNFLNNLMLKEDDNIDLLLSMLSLDEEKPPANTHHTHDEELTAVIEESVDHKLYVEQMYQAMLAMYYENHELHKKLDVLTACNELLKSHISQNIKTTELNDYDDDDLFFNFNTTFSNKVSSNQFTN